MRIAMVSEHASPLAAIGGVDAGGQNVHVAALSLGLAARGHDVVVYTRRDSERQSERVQFGPGVQVVHLDAGPPVPIPKDELLQHMPEFGWRLAEDWDVTGTPDVAHAHFWMSGLATLQAARETGTPVVQTFHALGTVKRRFQQDRDSSPAERIRAEERIGDDVDLVIATCSDEVLELRRMGVPVTKITVVPCGVDTSLFAPRPAGTDRHGTAAAGRPFRLLSAGRLVERKGVDTAVQALVALPGVELVVAGGPKIDELGRDPEAGRLLGLADSLGVADRVRLLGSVPHERLPELMAAADAVVCAPWYEPFGIVPIEAAACGRPLIGSSVGGLLDTVVDGVTGLLIPPRDPSALAAAVRELAADPLRRRAFGLAARRRAVALYDWGSVAAATDRAYRALVSSASQKGVLA